MTIKAINIELSKSQIQFSLTGFLDSSCLAGHVLYGFLLQCSHFLFDDLWKLLNYSLKARTIEVVKRLDVEKILDEFYPSKIVSGQYLQVGLISYFYNLHA